jgi:hypothetical protein
MGMTDRQFNSHLRALVADIKRALEVSPYNEPLQELLKRLQADLED